MILNTLMIFVIFKNVQYIYIYIYIYIFFFFLPVFTHKNGWNILVKIIVLAVIQTY